MKTIQELVKELVDSGETSNEIASYLSISVSMVSAYKKQSYNPSITVAKTVYTKSQIVLHPFSEESLQLEIAKDKR